MEPKKPEISEEAIQSFNDQMDNIREKLFKQVSNPNLSDLCMELASRMEIARQVFNHFVETGQVVIPGLAE